MNRDTVRALSASAMLGLLSVACSDSNDGFVVVAPEPPVSCETAASAALRACVVSVSGFSRQCYVDGGSACSEGDADIAAALSLLRTETEAACADGDLFSLGADSVVGRLRNACTAQADSIAWRTFGGPQGAVWPAADREGRDCLEAAHTRVVGFLDESLAAIDDCLEDADCDGAAVRDFRGAAAADAAADIAAACPALDESIAVDAATYVDRAARQVDCIAATVHEDPAPLSLDCGPTNVEVMPARGGEWTEIVLEGERWGTMCGDGTDYAIYMRLAPEGGPLDRTVVALEGGGVCLFEEDCRMRLEAAPQLFNAQDGVPAGGGIAGRDPDNPFADWNWVYMPYCNQDVFIGGGVVEELGELRLPRHGAVNLRAGMRVARDIIWKALDEEGGRGYRPDELIALFGGFSAGAYGTLYNYHWVLDDLQWPRTAAFPDSGGALDNGGVGVRALGLVKIPAWGSASYLSPYCFTGDCAVGPFLYRAMSPRLKRTPEQQFLILSNQKDNIQQLDSFFFDEAEWIDTLRRSYCETRDLPGIQYYYTSDSRNSVHVVSIRDDFFYGSVAGERMVDWLWRGVTDPDSVEDRVEEGDFTVDIPGSRPFPCALTP